MLKTSALIFLLINFPVSSQKSTMQIPFIQFFYRRLCPFFDDSMYRFIVSIHQRSIKFLLEELFKYFRQDRLNFLNAIIE
jgi:hypothetical protein